MGGYHKRYFTGQTVPRFPNRTWDQILDHVERGDAAGPAALPYDRGELGPVNVLITETLPAATWEAGKLAPRLVEVELWSSAADFKLVRSGVKILVRHTFVSAVTVSDGKGKIGKVIGGELFNVDCNEIDLSEAS